MSFVVCLLCPTHCFVDLTCLLSLNPHYNPMRDPIFSLFSHNTDESTGGVKSLAQSHKTNTQFCRVRSRQFGSGYSTYQSMYRSRKTNYWSNLSPRQTRLRHNFLVNWTPKMYTNVHAKMFMCSKVSCSSANQQFGKDSGTALLRYINSNLQSRVK